MGYQSLQKFLRDRAIKSAVKERGWAWTGDSLPSGLQVREFYGATRKVTISNAFQGRKGVIDFVGFDCVVGEGRGRSQFSMVAALSGVSCFGAEKFDPSLEVIRMDEWCAIRRTFGTVAIHRPGYFCMSVKEMLSIIDSIG